MRKARIVLILGTWVAILPYLGFPYSWKDTLSFFTGIALIGFSYILHKDAKNKEHKEKTFDNFKENIPEIKHHERGHQISAEEIGPLEVEELIVDEESQN
ncbi:MAG: hypothetical protein P4L63_03590 [Candidatus Pacebacteria bacterium]|nr:hypothetical protein [Candidatus Paceibacterota bacterium]